MSSIAISTRRTNVKTPSTKRVGRTTSAKTRNVSPVAQIWATNPSETSDADSEPRYIAARAELSATVDPRAPWSAKCSVVSVVSNVWRSTSSGTWFLSTPAGDDLDAAGRANDDPG